MELSKDIIEAIAEKTLEKFLAGPFGELRDGQKALAERIDRIEARMDRLEAKLDRVELRIDALGARIDEMGARLDARIDALTREQARLAEEVAALKTDRSVTADVIHRLSRVEDKLYA
ncbi:MAG: hypothetical protein HY736_10340 [Verrucomicrobia bacterium]|nr:hypothetical protein [Verrucomicrobiota bacterium]